MAEQEGTQEPCIPNPEGVIQATREMLSVAEDLNRRAREAGTPNVEAEKKVAKAKRRLRFAEKKIKAG